jgi:hypothetical protein
LKIGTALEVAEKPEFFEGDGLQAVHNCFAVSAALAAEGRISIRLRTFSAASLAPARGIRAGDAYPTIQLGI